MSSALFEALFKPGSLGRVRAVTSDSRAVGPGAAFVAVRGGREDGHRYIAQAVKAGAELIVGEDPAPAGAPAYVQVPDARLALAWLAAGLEGHPSHSLLMVGVTGTSGKTTSTYLLESILTAAGHRVGVIGTVSFRSPSKSYPSTHTTPGAPELQRLLAEMKHDGCTAVVMEVSSHALKQHRVAFIAWDAMVFTNLTPEHLDFHPDMEDYFRSKAMLFDEAADYSIECDKHPYAAVSIDDEWGRRLLAELHGRRRPEFRFASFGLAADAALSGGGLRVDLSGIHGVAGGVQVASELTGRFNAQNLLGAVSVAQGLGFDGARIAQGISRLASVPGRMERVPNPQGIHVLVDYAHKSDALEKVLRTLGDVRGGQRLITVFGCGGERDRTKRPVMGKLAVSLSDAVFVTSDNPRGEDPQAIIREILAGTAGATHLTVEPDRRKAIFAAIRSARPGDLVLIAGKGHEDYQIIADPAASGKTIKIHFDDREVAREALSE